MDEEEEFQKAKSSAIRMLAFRARSTQEISDRLHRKGISASLTQRVVNYLNEYGYLDDQAFAQQWAKSLVVNKGWGFARIKVDLRSRGISPDLAEETIARLRKDHSEEETARRILGKRFSHLDLRKISPKDKNRLIRFFQSRGFSWETILRVVRI
ncbi:MAG: regulatory protein RecX [Deltaproteobacteria bacterium]|nr:regulatory protein RecX [Deltaproteobacteria bacterium]